MSGKIVWVIGGLVLAVGAVAYLSYHETPAGKDAAGTIVEAKRAISDSSSGPSSTSTTGSTDDSSTNSGDKASDQNTGSDRNDRNDYTRDVRRCETTMSGSPAYWDVRYKHRGIEHRVQMTAPPGRTIYVNRDGEPRQ